MRIGRSGAGRDPTDTTYHWWETTRAEQDHLEIPVPYKWRIAGTIIGVIVVTFLVTVVLAVDDSDPIGYRSIPATAIESDPEADPLVTSVEVDVEQADPDVGRVRVRGEAIVRVDIAGDALCGPVSGADDAWIDVRLCGDLDSLAITVRDDDGSTSTALARF